LRARSSKEQLHGKADFPLATGVLILAVLAAHWAPWSFWAAGFLALAAISGSVPMPLRRHQS